MQFQEFLGQVQMRAQLPSTGHALAATRATLITLGERLSGGEPAHLAAQLPQELAHLLTRGDATSLGSGQRFSASEFCARIARREGVEPLEAARHARAVVEVLDEAVSSGEMQDVRKQLPEDLRDLIDSGLGELRHGDDIFSSPSP